MAFVPQTDNRAQRAARRWLADCLLKNAVVALAAWSGCGVRHDQVSAVEIIRPAAQAAVLAAR
ncbi:MAG: hypothetical protein WD845_18100, partial [Pirellulales bacterium]